MKKSEVRYRLLRRELIAFALAVWFTIGVALVEDSLEEGLRVTDNEVFGEYCVRTDALYDFSSINFIRAPYNFPIDDWSQDIAKQVSCGDRGLRTLQFGGDNGTVLTEGQVTLSAPTCGDGTLVDDPIFPELNKGFTFISVGYIRGGTNGLEMDGARVTILPFNQIVGTSRNITKNNLNIQMEENIPIESCQRLNIVEAPMRTFKTWEIVGADDYNVSRIILKNICDNLGESTLPDSIPEEDVNTCLIQTPGNVTTDGRPTVMESNGELTDLSGTVNFSCIYDKTAPSQRSFVNITNLGLYIAQDTSSRDEVVFGEGAVWASRALACPEVDILEIEYMLLPTRSIRKMARQVDFSHYHRRVFIRGKQLLVIQSLRVISGKCETTIPSLGLWALVHMASAHWKNQSLTSK